MNDMKPNKDFFKGLIQKQGVEKAPEGFTDRVMAAIPESVPETGLRWWQQSNAWIWASVGAGIVGLVVMVFTLDFSFMGSLFTGIGLDSSLVDRVTQEIGRELLGMTDGFTLSPISLIIIIALAALFILDRLIRRRPGVGQNSLSSP